MLHLDRRSVQNQIQRGAVSSFSSLSLRTVSSQQGARTLHQARMPNAQPMAREQTTRGHFDSSADLKFGLDVIELRGDELHAEFQGLFSNR
jgi:hypothetical protein